MTTYEDRAVGTIVGALICDAAAVPIQWVYDADKLNKEILAGKDPEFFARNVCPFFTLQPGKSTYYGEELFVLLESLVESKGWDQDNFRKKLYNTFGPGTAYDYAANGIDPEKRPIKSPWLSTVLKMFINHYQGNGDPYNKDPVIETPVLVSPLVALYAGKPELKTYLMELSQTLQDSAVATELTVTTGLILEQIVLNDPPLPEAVGAAVKGAGELTQGLAKEVKELKTKNVDCTEAVGQFGRHCGGEACFKGSLYSIYSGKADFVSSNRFSMRAGGDVCGRGQWIGALLGAKTGINGLPKDWVEKTELAQQIIALAKQLVALRK